MRETEKVLVRKQLSLIAKGYTLRKIMPALFISKFSFNVLLSFFSLFFFDPFHEKT